MVKRILLHFVMLTICFIYSAEARTIVVFGDSLVAGYGLNENQSFPAKLQDKLIKQGYEDYKVINAGISGETTAGALARVNWVVSNFKPDIVILVSGGNDLLRGLSPSNTKSNLDSLLKILDENKIKILLCGMQAPANIGVKFSNDFNKIYEDLADKYDAVLYPFFLEGVYGDPSLNLTDGIHPNSAGLDKITEQIFPYVLKIF